MITYEDAFAISAIALFVGVVIGTIMQEEMIHDQDRIIRDLLAENQELRKLMEIIQNYEKLRRVIQRKLNQWNEYSTFTISGIRGLTRSDIDCLLMCCDWYEHHGDLEGLDYFSPVVRKVLEKYKMI